MNGWERRGPVATQGIAAHVRRISVAFTCFIAGYHILHAQGTFQSMQTGGNQTLISRQEVLAQAGAASPSLLFKFGFVTDELNRPQTLLDSFTVTVQNPLTAASAVLGTIDAAGVFWLPVSPNNLPLSDTELQRQSIIPPSLEPVLGRGVAYSVALALPSEFVGSNLNVYFDLFDNHNGVNSIGWFDNLQITSVPEPEVWTLLSLSIGALALLRRK